MTRATLGLGAAVLMLTAGAGGATAQSSQQPTLIFSISGGYTTAGPLWTLDKQAVTAPDNQYDTVALARRLRPGFSAVLGATLFKSSHLGYGLEVGLFGLASESRCAPIDSFRTDSQQLNYQACNSIQGRHIPTNMVAFQAGLTYRLGADASAQPYVRAATGFAILGNSFVQTVGDLIASSPSNCQQGCSLLLLDAKDRTEMVWTATLAVGISLPMNPGYRLRAELRDVIAALPVVTGPANPRAAAPVAPTGTTVRHVPTLTIGLDVVLERRRTRRY